MNFVDGTAWNMARWKAKKNVCIQIIFNQNNWVALPSFIVVGVTIVLAHKELRCFPDIFITRESILSIYCTIAWLSPKTILDSLAKRKILTAFVSNQLQLPHPQPLYSMCYHGALCGNIRWTKKIIRQCRHNSSQDKIVPSVLQKN
jgi:hypothetical protein